MSNIFNKIFLVFKNLFLFIAFALTLYILLYMYYSLNKQPLGRDFLEFFGVLFPFIILMGLFFFNLISKQDIINKNILYNAASLIVVLAITYMAIRALFDKNMVLWYKTIYHINFDYFADQIFQIKAMLYGLIMVNIVLIMENLITKKIIVDN